MTPEAGSKPPKVLSQKEQGRHVRGARGPRRGGEGAEERWSAAERSSRLILSVMRASGKFGSGNATI